MHLYPARLSSALPVSLDLFSSISLLSLLHCPSYIRFFLRLLHSLTLCLSCYTKSFHGPSNVKEKEEKEACSYRRRRVPVVCFFSPTLLTELQGTEKDQMHPAEMHPSFPICLGDKRVTLSECCWSNERPVCDFDSELKYRLSSN